MESISGWEAVEPQTFSETSLPIPSIVNYERDLEQEREQGRERTGIETGTGTGTGTETGTVTGKVTISTSAKTMEQQTILYTHKHCEIQHIGNMRFHFSLFYI
jgi:hypothetical protein